MHIGTSVISSQGVNRSRILTCALRSDTKPSKRSHQISFTAMYVSRWFLLLTATDLIYGWADVTASSDYPK